MLEFDNSSTLRSSRSTLDDSAKFSDARESNLTSNLLSIVAVSFAIQEENESVITFARRRNMASVLSRELSSADIVCEDSLVSWLDAEPRVALFLDIAYDGNRDEPCSTANAVSQVNSSGRVG